MQTVIEIERSERSPQSNFHIILLLTRGSPMDMRRHKRFALQVLFTLCFPLVGVIISLNVSRINEISFQRCLIKVVWIMLWLVTVFIQ